MTATIEMSNQKVFFVLWKTLHELSGVTTSVMRLRSALRSQGIPSGILLVNPHFYPSHRRGAEFVVTDWREYRAFLAAQGRCTVVILSESSFVRCLLETYRAKLSGVPVTILGDYQSDSSEEFYRWVGLYERLCDGLITVSERVRDEVRRRTTRPIPVRYVPRGVPCVEKPVWLPPEPLRMIYTGRLEQRQKRILDFVEFIDELDRTGTAYRITFVGEGPEAGALRRLLASQRRQGKVTFEGRLPVNQVLELCRHSHFFVNLSEYEGLSQSMIEAVGQGCSAAVTDVSGTRQVVDDGVSGLAVPVGEARVLARRLAALARVPGEVDRYRERAWRRAQKEFSLARSIHELADVLREARAGEAPGDVDRATLERWIFRERFRRQFVRLHPRKLAGFVKERLFPGPLTPTEGTANLT